uniref:(northern house mosquito) hypothetical protein n=2 Tax=Culex pipiens TaxID=7175 RepID=A0A8D8JID7_CULPI
MSAFVEKRFLFSKKGCLTFIHSLTMSSLSFTLTNLRLQNGRFKKSVLTRLFFKRKLFHLVCYCSRRKTLRTQIQTRGGDINAKRGAELFYTFRKGVCSCGVRSQSAKERVMYRTIDRWKEREGMLHSSYSFFFAVSTKGLGSLQVFHV